MLIYFLFYLNIRKHAYQLLEIVKLLNLNRKIYLSGIWYCTCTAVIICLLTVPNDVFCYSFPIYEYSGLINCIGNKIIRWNSIILSLCIRFIKINNKRIQFIDNMFKLFSMSQFWSRQSVSLMISSDHSRFTLLESYSYNVKLIVYIEIKL